MVAVAALMKRALLAALMTVLATALVRTAESTMTSRGLIAVHHGPEPRAPGVVLHDAVGLQLV